MDFLKDWAFSVCCAVLICGIFDILLPEGSFRKTFKVILSLFFICIVISPITKINFSDIKNDIKISSGAEEFDENSEKIYNLQEKIY